MGFIERSCPAQRKKRKPKAFTHLNKPGLTENQPEDGRKETSVFRGWRRHYPTQVALNRNWNVFLDSK